MFIQFTIFETAEMKAVRQFGQYQGQMAARYIQSLRSVKGFEPREGDVICGVRIDRLESEHPSL